MNTSRTITRTEFIRRLGGLGLITSLPMHVSALANWAASLPQSEKMPVVFVGHGSPMNAIEDNAFSRGWRQAAKDLRPAFILCISAHWETRGTFVTAQPNPKTIHDFGGFPQALFDMEYPAPGSPELAHLITEKVAEPHIEATDRWGLDHGTWSVLAHMFPKADVPVVQMSLDRTLSPEKMYDLGKALSFLRSKGVLIIASGNIVHNLGMVRWGENPAPYDWAIEFDQQAKQLIDQRAHQQLMRYSELGKAAQLSIPTPEHYLPMLYVLGLQEKQEEVHHFNEQIAFGSGSMRSFIIS